MGTPLSCVYDAFFIKSNENFLYKNSQVFQYLKTGVANSEKTVPENLSYKYYTNNLVIILRDVAKNDGQIQLNINSNTYSISILSTDSLIVIADKIYNELKSIYDVQVNEGIVYPIITINYSENIFESVVDSNLTNVIFKDKDNTKLSVIVARTYNGEFFQEIGQASIDLIALHMTYEHKRFRKSELERIKQHIGTNDFPKLPDKFEEYKVVSQSMKDLKIEIDDFEQNFYSYDFSRRS